ncbi:MAG: DEAD/DEAH box helicase [Azospirillaceae bacterium]
MTTFSDLGLAEPILRAVTAEGYETPTPIQATVIPAMLAGRDVLGIAQTGTGKTAAFVLPLLDAIARGGRRPAARQCGALILVPTRELAQQVAESVRTYGQFTRHTVAVVVGGAKHGPQIRALARGVDILVATPGRLEDHLSAGVVSLERATTVVLDEADQMLDLGFMPAIRRILGKLPRPRRTMLLSATMPPPIRELARAFQTDPAEIAVTPVSRPVEAIDQSVVHVPSADKRALLADYLRGDAVDRALVFTRTKRGADKVMQHLDKAGVSSAAIHGNKSQGQRERALQAFRSGGVRVLVATDIAARGLDIDGVTHVVNYELPNVPEAYVHRIGRTARAGRSGIAITLCDPTERKLLRDIERLIGRSLAVAANDDATVRAVAAGDHGAARFAPSTMTEAFDDAPESGDDATRREPRSRGPKPVAKRQHRKGPRRQRTKAPSRGQRLDDASPRTGLERMLGNLG